jgi:hypothetical protein
LQVWEVFVHSQKEKVMPVLAAIAIGIVFLILFTLLLLAADRRSESPFINLGE